MKKVALVTGSSSVIVFQPGAIRTEWGRIALDNRQQTSGQTAYDAQSEEKHAQFLAAAGSASEPDVVAHEIIKTIETSRPRTRYVVGAGAKPVVFVPSFLPDRSNDWMMGAITKYMQKPQRRKSARQTVQQLKEFSRTGRG